VDLAAVAADVAVDLVVAVDVAVAAVMVAIVAVAEIAIKIQERWPRKMPDLRKVYG